MSDRHGFVIFVSGKCANTTIRTWFLKIECDEVCDDVGVMRAKTEKLKCRHLNSTKLDEYIKVIVVRNPYDRVLSLFLDKFAFPKDKNPLSDFGVRLMLTAEDVSFKEFLHLLKGSKFKGLDGHYLPQSKYRENILFDHIVKVENNGLEKLSSLVNRPVHFPFSEKAYGFQSNYSDSSGHELTSVKVSKYKENIAIHKDQLLTGDMRKEIYGIYKEDFEMFGYDK